MRFPVGLLLQQQQLRHGGVLPHAQLPAQVVRRRVELRWLAVEEDGRHPDVLSSVCVCVCVCVRARVCICACAYSIPDPELARIAAPPVEPSA